MTPTEALVTARKLEKALGNSQELFTQLDKASDLAKGRRFLGGLITSLKCALRNAEHLADETVHVPKKKELL